MFYPDSIIKNSDLVVFEGDTQTILPPIPINVRLTVNSVFMGLYAVLFCIVYIQLLLILCYGHKRFSYQSAFLFFCLIWAALRVTLFSFFYNSRPIVKNLNVTCYWVLYCLPVVLQFVTLSLLVLYFGQTILKSKVRTQPSNYTKLLWLGLVIVISIFIITNIVCAYILKTTSQPTEYKKVTVAEIRVMVNDSLFVIMSILLSWCIYKLMKLSKASAIILLESQGTTPCQAKTACILIILIYVTKAAYNFYTVVHCSSDKSQGWAAVSDQADLMYPGPGLEYISFGVALFIWEFLPTFIVVLFFRVQKPPPSLTASGFSSHSYKKGFFFDNPNRYDSEDDLYKSTITAASSPGANNSIFSQSVNTSRSFRHPGYGSLGTTPNLFNSYNPALQVTQSSPSNLDGSLTNGEIIISSQPLTSPK